MLSQKKKNPYADVIPYLLNVRQATSSYWRISPNGLIRRIFHVTKSYDCEGEEL